MITSVEQPLKEKSTGYTLTVVRTGYFLHKSPSRCKSRFAGGARLMN